MKHLVTFSCLLLAVAGVKDRKISLEDIERDYLSNEKKIKNLETKPTPPKQQSPSPTQFGFVPVKTASSYTQQEPKPHYLQVQPQYPQQYTLPEQYPVAPKYTSTPQQYTTTNQYTAQQNYAPQRQYYAYQQAPRLHQYPAVQYIADNSIQQQSTQHYQQEQQQYYTPQYYYVQQPAPSTSIQTVVDPKGGLQYIMYIPTYVPQTAEQSQTYENVVYSNTPQEQEYQTTQTVEQTPQYVPQTTQYVQPAKPRYTKLDFVPKREPKSLLDSYVPSILQIQYLKQQQQAQANALREPSKLSQTVVGKVEYVKSPSYRPQTAESNVEYVYQYPRAYRT